MLGRRAARASLLASASLLVALGSARGAVVDYADGSTDNNPIVLVDNTAQLQVLTGSATQAGIIAEAGGGGFGFEKIGAGTLILGDANNYSGATLVSAGTLRAGVTGAFVALSDYTIASGATLDLNGLDQVIGSLAGAGTVTNSGAGDATLYVGAFGFNSANTIFSGIIQDGGTNAVALEVETAGKLILTGANTYTGGTVICDCATLQIGDGGTTGSIVGDITAHNGTLIFDRSNAYTFAGEIIQGFGTPGIVIQNGGGVLTLSGDNDYAGGTVINAGTLSVLDDGNLGAVTGGVTINGATLKLSDFVALDEDRTITLTAAGGTIDTEAAFTEIDGTITGGGHLTVTGAGGYIANIGINDYSGGTTITGGATLLIEADGNFGAANGDIVLDNGQMGFFYGDVTLAATRTVTLGAGGGFVSVNASASEIAGTITGSGSLTIQVDAIAGGGGDLYLSGINDYSGGTALLGDACCGIPAIVVITDDRNLGHADGDISIDTGGIIFDANLTLNAGRTITISGGGALFDVGSNTVTIAGAIGGSGPMGKDGDGVLILTANNGITGDIDIVDGTLQLGNGGTAGSLAASIVTSSGTLAFNRSDTLIFAADISDSCGCFGGVVTQMGSGTTILTGANTYTGGTNITAGTLQIGNGGTAGGITGDVDNDGTLAFNRSDDIVFAGSVFGSGRVTKAGAGELTITAANSYGGGTTIGAGTVTLSGSGTLGTGAVSLSGVLRTATNRTVANTITLNAGADSTISAAAGATLNLTGNLTFSHEAGRTVYIGSVSDNGIVNVSSATVAVGTNAGALEIVGGTLRDISTTTPQSNFATSLGRLSSVTINTGATLEINSNGNGRGPSSETYIKLFGGGQLVMGGTDIPRVVLGDSNFAGLISGNGYIGVGGVTTGNNPATVTLTGDNNSAREFQIAAGSTLQVGNGGTTGSLAGSAHVVGWNFSGAPLLKFNRSDNITAANPLIGTFTLEQAGTGILALSGNNTNGGTVAFNGFAIVRSGGLSLSSNNNLNGRPVALSNATTLYTTADGTYASTVSITGTAALNVANGTTATWSGLVQNGTGVGTLEVAGGGTLILIADASHSGGTVVDAGTTLQVGNGGASGSLGGDVTDNGILSFNRSNDIVFAGAITGSGGLRKSGAGKLTLSGNNNFSGGITIVAGTVSFASSNASGTGAITTAGSVVDYANGIVLGSAIVVDGNTTRIQALSDVTATQSGAISQSGGTRSLEKIGAGTIILTGTNTYTGLTTITGGTLQLGDNGNTGSVAGNIVANGALIFKRSDAVTLAGIVSGSGTLTQAGSGTTILTGANLYTGNTIVGAGILRLGTGGSLAATGLIVTGGRFELNGGSITLTTLSGTGGTLDLGSGILTLNTGGTLASDVTGIGSLVKTGTGTLTLSGNNDFSGGITIAGGTVTFASGTAAGTGPITTTGSVIDYADGLALNNPIVINSTTTQVQVLTGTATQAGIISQTGDARPLEKIGAGTIILTAANTYTGATTVSGGRLIVDGSINSPVTVDSGAQLGGGGSVGATTVRSGGALSAGKDAVATLTINGNLTLASGSTLSVEAGPGSADRIIVNGDASLGGSLFANFQTGVTYAQTTYSLITASGTVSGSFSSFDTLGIPTGYRADIIYGANNVVLNLTPNDFIWSATAGSNDWNMAGNWTHGLVPDLTRTAEFTASSRTNIAVTADAGIGTIQLDSGAPAYGFTVTGSTFTIAEGVTQLTGNAASFTAGSGGTIAFSSSGSAGGSLLTAANGGTIRFGGTAHAGTGAQIVAQSGGVVDFSGTTGPGGAGDIRAGSIAGAGSIRLGANRLNAGESGASTEFSGVISGTGGLFKSGSGTLTLSGASTYTDATTVSAGTLVVNGSLASHVTLTGGALKGTGRIAGLTVNSGATVAPGNSIGTLNADSVIFAAGSTYEVELNDAGQADLIQAGGSASLNGALQVLAAAGNYAPVSNYRIVNAAGGVSGAFASVTSNQADLTPSLVYSANAVDLRLMRNNIQFGAAYGATPNQIAAGGGVSAGGAASPMYVAVANAYAPGTIGATLDGLSGEIYASQRSAALEDSRMIRNTVLARLASNPEDTGGWAAGLADYGTLDSDGNAGEGQRQNAGFIAGVDFMVSEGMRLGLGGAYAENKLSIASRASTARGVLGSLLAYVSYRSEGFALQMGGSYGWGESSAVRVISVPAETAGADRNVETGSVFAQASYDFGLPILPYAGVSHVSLNHGAFAETGGIAALSGGGVSDAETYSILGFRAPVGSFEIHGMTLTSQIDIGWSHAFDAAAPAQNLAFATGAGFTVLGVPIGRDAAALQLGFGLTIVPGADLSVGYDGTFSGRGQSHAVRGGLNWRF